MAARLNLVSASAGKRFGAWAIDRIPPVVVVGIAYGISVPAVLQAAASGSEADAAGALGGMLLWLSIAALLALAYTVWKWIWEARSGKTPGNLLLGLRTANEDGEAPGLAAIFIRGLILAVSGVVPVAGPIVVTISNLWDSNHKRQGWHDKVAKTLVLDVNAGRDPLTTGGLYGAASFGPGGAEPQGAFAGAMAGPGSHATDQAAAAAAAGGGSPFAGQQWPAFDANAAASGSIISGIPGFSAPAKPATSTTTAAGTAPTSASATAASAPGPSAAAAHADDDLAFTRVRTEATAAAPAPATRPAGVTIRFDDGREVQVEGSALIGRNPAAAQGEDVDQLIDFADMGRSVSKTHLQLRVEGNTVWVGDRNSTNGTAVTGADGVRQQLTPGSPAQALIGDTVHFGDRSFIIGQA